MYDKIGEKIKIAFTSWIELGIMKSQNPRIDSAE